MEIEFKCKKCSSIFTCESGNTGISEESFRPEIEKEIICPECGKLSIDDVLLTEKVQSQLTELCFEDDDDDNAVKNDRAIFSPFYYLVIGDLSRHQ